MLTAATQNALPPTVSGKLIGWLFLLNPEEPNQSEHIFTDHQDIAKFRKENTDVPMEMFGRYQIDSNGVIELDLGYNDRAVVGTRAYRARCKKCEKTTTWFDGTAPIGRNYGGFVCENCSYRK